MATSWSSIRPIAVRLLVVGFGFAATFASAVHGATDAAELLAKLYPAKLQPHVSVYTHVLLFHGLGPTRLPDVPSGRDALAALTDEEVAIQMFGASPFVRTRAGVRYLLTSEPMSRAGVGESHRDQCLATFAALKLPLTTPLRLKAGTYALADLLTESVASFSYQQAEPAWTAIAFAEYMPPQKEWTNRFRERFTFSGLADHLLRLDLNQQGCSGTHVLEAIAKLALADKRVGILDAHMRVEVARYLDDVCRQLTHSQLPDGSWNKGWIAALTGSARPSSVEDRVLVTGHLLGAVNDLHGEWSIPLEARVRAAEWLRSVLDADRLEANPNLICPVTHATMAMARTLQEAGASRSASQRLPADAPRETNKQMQSYEIDTEM